MPDIDCLLADDIETGKSVLRDYINATVGFEKLGQVTDRSPKSLMRMFGPDGNPQARSRCLPSSTMPLQIHIGSSSPFAEMLALNC